MTTLKFLSNNDSFIKEDDTIYITFSKVSYIKHKNNLDIIYFFDIDHLINEKKENGLLEKNLFIESKINEKRYFPLTFKYIYKYLLTYNQFYNRIIFLMNKYKNIKIIEYSNNMSFVFKRVITAITLKYSIKTKINKEYFVGFSYRHSSEMLSDLPVNIESNNILLYLYSIYLRLKNHKIFIFPFSSSLKLPKSVNIFRISIFSIIDKFLKSIGITKSNKHSSHILKKIDFSIKPTSKYTLNKDIWKNYRNDQIDLIEYIINVFFDNFTIKYLDTIKIKFKNLLKWSNTKCVILDETIDAYRRLVSSSCFESNIEVEYIPHGIISEDLQFSYTSDKQYTDKYIPKTLAWNSNSASYLNNMSLNAEAINFPVNIDKPLNANKKDILVLLSYGDRVNLNQFEEDILSLLALLNKKKYHIDWKIHHNFFNESNKARRIQKESIEELLNTKLNFIPHDTRASSIMKNYDLIIFTTYTTGIYEAALLNVPFLIYSNENEDCHGVNISSLPIAYNDDDFKNLLEKPKKDYLGQIKDSLLENISLKDYLIMKCI